MPDTRQSGHTQDCQETCSIFLLVGVGGPVEENGAVLRDDLEHVRARQVRNLYRGTSLIRTTPSQDSTVGLYLGSFGGPRGGGLFLMSEVPLYTHENDLLVCYHYRYGLLEVRDDLEHVRPNLCGHVTRGVRVLGGQSAIGPISSFAAPPPRLVTSLLLPTRPARSA